MDRQPEPALRSAPTAADSGVSVVVPAYNEQESIAGVVDAIHDVLSRASI